MAKIRPTMGTILGGVAGVVYQRGPSGVIVRRRTPGTHNQGSNIGAASGAAQTLPAKSAARAYLGSITALWNQLNPAQKAAWIAWTLENRPELGSQPTDNLGRLGFSSVNLWRQINRLATLAAPPAPPTPLPRANITNVTLVGTQVTITFNPSPLGAGNSFHVKIGHPIIGARTPRLARAGHGPITPANSASPRTTFILHNAQLGQRLPLWIAIVQPASHTIGEYRRFDVTAA